MTSANITNLVIGVAVLALLVSGQLTIRRLRENYRLPVILAVTGVVRFGVFLTRVARREAAGQVPVSGARVPLGKGT